MAKNLIFIILDSVTQGQLEGTERRNCTTSFLHELRNNALWSDRMFSQGPYTEAALTSILCGNDLLDGGGYMKRNKYKRNVLEVFKSAGYETFVNHFAPQVYPSAMFVGAEPMYHQSYYVFREFWNYRLSYYSPLFLKGELTDTELSMLKDMLDENLEAWIGQLELVLSDNPMAVILRKNSTLTGAAEELDTIKQEYSSFTADPMSYLKELFTQKEEHTLLSFPKRTCDARVPANIQAEVRQRYTPLFRRMWRSNFKRNIKNLPYPLKRIVRALMSGKSEEAKALRKMYGEAICDADLMARIGENYTTFRASVSCRGYFEHYLEWLDSRADPSRPLMSYLHLDDAHTPETFFSWDSSDLSVIDGEMAAIRKYLDELPKAYRGALTSDLSLLYVDNCLRWLFNELDARGIFEDTDVIFMGDHGFSFYYDPLRDDYWQHFHRELMNPPFMLWHKGGSEDYRHGYYMSKDISPTLLDDCGLPIPEWMSGRSLLSFAGRDYALHEYMGSGCPDMNRRPVRMGIHTDNYYVLYEAHVTGPFENGVVTEVYDLEKDPLELHNIADTTDSSLIARELAILKERFESLYRNFTAAPNAFNDPDPYGDRLRRAAGADLAASRHERSADDTNRL